LGGEAEENDWVLVCAPLLRIGSNSAQKSHLVQTYKQSVKFYRNTLEKKAYFFRVFDYRERWLINAPAAQSA